MNYPCGKFGNCSFSRFGFIMRTDRQTDEQTDAHADAEERFTPATVVGVSVHVVVYSEQRTECFGGVRT